MKIQPVNTRVLVRLHFPPETDIILPKANVSVSAGDKRTKLEVIAIGDKVTNCKVGDFLLIHPDCWGHLIPTSKEPPEGLIDAHHILAIVLDDEVFELN
jgi:co-chaperonin GroES (HSP10)